MPRNPSDPGLALIAQRLSNVTMSDEGGILYEEASEIFSSNRAKLVAVMPDFKTYCVRYYIGGLRRTLGVTQNVGVALRFADMIAMHFWIYRIRGVREPLQSDLNFSPAQAKADLINEDAAVVLIEQIEDYLQSISAIVPADQVESRRKADRKSRDTHRTARFEYLKLYDDMTNRLKILSEINERLKRVEQQVGVMQPSKPCYIETPVETPQIPYRCGQSTLEDLFSPIDQKPTPIIK